MGPILPNFSIFVNCCCCCCAGASTLTVLVILPSFPAASVSEYVTIYVPTIPVSTLETDVRLPSS